MKRNYVTESTSWSDQTILIVHVHTNNENFDTNITKRKY